MSTEILGWIATAVFIASYFFDSRRLRYVQALGAGLWLVYGLLMHAMPVVVCNTLVLLVAFGSSFRKEKVAQT